MYETLQEMEQAEKERNENNEEDPINVRKAMEAALLFGGAK